MLSVLTTPSLLICPLKEKSKVSQGDLIVRKKCKVNAGKHNKNYDMTNTYHCIKMCLLPTHVE